MPSLVTYTVSRMQRPDLRLHEPRMKNFSDRAIGYFVVSHSSHLRVRAFPKVTGARSVRCMDEMNVICSDLEECVNSKNRESR